MLANMRLDAPCLSSMYSHTSTLRCFIASCFCQAFAWLKKASHTIHDTGVAETHQRCLDLLLGTVFVPSAPFPLPSSRHVTNSGAPTPGPSRWASSSHLIIVSFPTHVYHSAVKLMMFPFVETKLWQSARVPSSAEEAVSKAWPFFCLPALSTFLWCCGVKNKAEKHLSSK